MEHKIQKQIIDYFSTFEEFYNTSRTCLKACQNCAISINKCIKRYNNINQACLTGTPLEEFDDLKSKLSTSLFNIISKDIDEIRSQGSIIEELFENLCHKSNILKESCKDIDWSLSTLLIKGTPFQPSLKQILEFVDDSVTFGSEIYAHIDSSLNILALKGPNCESLIDNFKISTKWQRKVEEILTYTSFCSDNQI